MKAITAFTNFRSASLRHAFPCSATDCIEFVVHLVNKGFAPSIVTTYMSAISYMHKCTNLPDPTSDFLVKKTLIGARNLLGEPDKRKPFSLNSLHDIVSALDRINISTFEREKYKAMFVTMFYGLIRIGEVTIHRKSDNNKVLQLDDVTFYHKQRLSSMIIEFRQFKHSDPTSSASIKLVAINTEHCPVNRLYNYIAIRGQQQGPLFTNENGAPVTSSQFSSVFNSCLKIRGLDKNTYKPHCFRFGGATYYAQLGMNDDLLQRFGRWKSQAYKKYIRNPCFDYLKYITD